MRRVCEFCKDGVEDEMHVLLCCGLYDDLRQSMMDRLYVGEEWELGEDRRRVMAKVMMGENGVGGVEEVGKERKEAVMEFMRESM